MQYYKISEESLKTLWEDYGDYRNECGMESWSTSFEEMLTELQIEKLPEVKDPPLEFTI
jgi:hypothetical protein